MALPVILGGLLLGGGSFLAGRSSGGGGGIGVEAFTSKKTNQTTNTSQDTYSSIFSPTTTNANDYSRNISFGGNVSTKKEQAISQTPNISPNISPSQSVTPSSSQGAGGGGIGTGGGSSGVDFQGIALMGGVGLVAFFLLKPKKNGK